MKKLIWLPLAVLIPVMAYMVFSKQHSRDTDVKDLQELHAAYAQSIVLPWINDSIEVLVYQYAGPDCGNTSDEEYQSIFIPDLLEEPYKNSLSSPHNNFRVLSEFDSLGKTIPENKKMYYYTYGDVKTKELVDIIEHYHYLEQDTMIHKTALYLDDKWSILAEEASENE